MKEQLKGIALVLFGILLCCAEKGLNYTVFVNTCDIPFSLLGVIVGVIGVFFTFKNRENK